MTEEKSSGDNQIAKVLKTIMKEHKMSRREFAHSIGASPQAVTFWEQGAYTPNAKYLSAICEKYNVPPKVFFTITEDETTLHLTFKEDDGTVAIPRFNAYGSCGTGVSNQSEQMIGLVRVSLAWLQAKCPSIRAKSLEVITASGDSMSPTIKNLDFLFIDRSETEVRGDGIYAVIYAGDVFVKRVQRQPDGGLLLISDNTRYPPILIPPEQLEHVKIAGKCKIHCSAEEI